LENTITGKQKTQPQPHYLFWHFVYKSDSMWN